MSRFIPLVALCALAVACTPAEEVATLPSQPATGVSAARNRGFVVFAQNAYVGTDVDAVLTAPPEELASRLFAALNTFVSTDWGSRAGAIADAIGRSGADLVALNEMTTLTVQGLAPMFPDLTVDFLTVLQGALASRGLDYQVAGIVANTDANLQLGGPVIRLQDFDVVLVRSGVAVSNVIAANYTARAPVSLGPLGDLTITRGRVQLDATMGDRSVRFVATHLEPVETSPLLQAAQASELVSALSGSPLPVIIAGDLNTVPTDQNPASPYAQFRAARFSDIALVPGVKRPAAVNTCCHAPDLRNAAPTLVKRIDHILFRSDERSGGPQGIAVRQMELFGDDLHERTQSGLWPSDHAGVLATFDWRAGGFFSR